MTHATPSYDDRNALSEIEGLTKCGDGYIYAECTIIRESGEWTATHGCWEGGVEVVREGFRSIQEACDWIDTF